MNNRTCGELVGERVGLQIGLPEKVHKVGDYTLLDDPDKLLVPESFQATVKEMGDTAPMFVTVAVPIGKSRKLASHNDPAQDQTHRIWPEQVMDTLVSHITERALPGYRGHAKDDDDLSSVPNASTLWLAAAKAERADGKKAILVRGYVYDVDNTRDEIKTGALSTVSPLAITKSHPEVIDGERAVMVEQSNWLSLDWVRPNTEGFREAVIVSKEGAALGMLTPEMAKVIAELSREDLEKLNPGLVHTLSKENAATSPNTETINNLVGRVQELTCENATLAIEASRVNQVAAVLGCKPDELTGKIGELKTMQANAARLACETAIAALGNNPLRDVVAKRLKDVQFGSVEEAKEAVSKEMATAKEYIAALGGNLNLGSVNASGNSVSSESGMLGSFGQQLMEG